MKLVLLKNIVLSKDGLNILKKIILSSPTCQFDSTIFYFKEKEINLEFLNKLVPSGAAFSLYSYAKKVKKNRLTSLDVIFCFSSKEHFNEVKYHAEINKEKLKEMGFNISGREGWQRYYLAHLLLPVKVIAGDKNRLSALYNDRILLKNIFSDQQCKKGELILVHFGKLIQKIKEKIYLKILNEQLEIFLPKISNKKGVFDKILDFKKDLGINLWQHNKSNYQKYHL